VGSGYLQVQGEKYTVGQEDSRTFLLMPGLRFSDRRYDDLVRPRKGYLVTLELRGTDQALGSDTAFLQFMGFGNLRIPLPYRFSLLTRGQFGTTMQEDKFESLPPSVRFFAGGDNSVRGYDYKSLGPKDDDGDVVGGKHLLVGSIELEKAIGKVFGVAAFYDVGNAFDKVSDMDVQQGAGVGIRLYAPFGYLRFDLARQLNVRDPDYRIHFAVGIGL
jgi:translocation and assembly module TamA